jgi:hypothetical protein
MSLNYPAISNNQDLHTYKGAGEKPVDLRAQQAKIDNSVPKAKQFEGRVEQLRNSEITEPESDWNRIYAIGRQAYVDGDYKRALDAFQYALQQTDTFEDGDPRIKMTKEAIEKSRAAAGTLAARTGFMAEKNVVQKVFPGSLAWLAGLRSGDHILSTKAADQKIALTVERNHKKYTVNLTERSATSDTSKQSHISTAYLGVLKQNERLLEDHDCIILVDKSGSMANPDGVDGLSKWDWCRKSTLDLMQSAGHYFDDKVTISPFDTRFQAFTNADVSKVGNVFQQFQPLGGTRPEAPLAYELHSYFARRATKPKVKPLIVAIVSDGMPNDPGALRDVIFDATTQMRNKNEICITFLQIGQNFEGTRIISALDHDLVAAGAKYDIVNTMPFEDLQKVGFKYALVDALMKQRTGQLPSVAGTAGSSSAGKSSAGVAAAPGAGTVAGTDAAAAAISRGRGIALPISSGRHFRDLNRPNNLNFEEGMRTNLGAGQTSSPVIPSGWVLQGAGADNYRVSLESASNGGKCATIQSVGSAKNASCSLDQIISADAYIGRRIKVSAYIKAENVTGSAGLAVHVDGYGHALSYSDMWNHRIHGNSYWTKYEAVVDVPKESRTIQFGVQLEDGGKVSVDNVTIEVVAANTRVTD